MNRKILKRRLAAQDIVELAAYIAQDSIQAAERFLEATENAFHFLAESPGAGARRTFKDPDLSDIRMWPIRGFDKHLVFYREDPSGIEVIRVLHAARDIPALFRKPPSHS